MDIMTPTSESLALSGLQHFLFCPRQWALIHIENQWAENYLTADGEIMHKRAHDASCRELRGDVLTVRALRVKSEILGINGVCDIVEYHRKPEGIKLAYTEGTWLPYPVEYKRGTKKISDCDRIQLCAQAMCLEEMHGCLIPEGAIYYGQEAHREIVPLDERLKQLVSNCCETMHDIFQRGQTPEAKPNKGCKSCSLMGICLPKLPLSVELYLRADLEVD